MSAETGAERKVSGSHAPVAVKRTDAGQESDLAAQVSAPSFPRHGGFESAPLDSHSTSCGGAGSTP